MAKYSTGKDTDEISLEDIPEELQPETTQVEETDITLPDETELEQDTEELEYLVEIPINSNKDHLPDEEMYIFDGLTQYQQHKENNFREDIREDKLADHIEHTEEILTQTIEENSNSINDVITEIDEAYEQVAQETGHQDPIKMAAIQGSLGQGTCIPGKLRGEDDWPDADLLLIGQEYLEDDWSSSQRKQKAEDRNTVEALNHLEDNRGQSADYQLPLHPIGITEDRFYDDEGNIDPNLERGTLTPDDYDGGIEKTFDDLVVQAWEGMMVPKRYADKELLNALHSRMEEVTNEYGQLDRGELNLTTTQDKRIKDIDDMMRERYGDDVFYNDNF